MAVTILQALKDSIVIPNVSDTAFEKALIDAELNGDDDYTLANKEAVNLAAVAILRSLPITSVSEGGYTITFDRKAIDDNISTLIGGSAPVRGVQRLNI